MSMLDQQIFEGDQDIVQALVGNDFEVLSDSFVGFLTRCDCAQRGLIANFTGPKIVHIGSSNIPYEAVAQRGPDAGKGSNIPCIRRHFARWKQQNDLAVS
eukprot:m51a1_g447 hypothetical protein (100) ;mRNA; r:117089-117580